MIKHLENQIIFVYLVKGTVFGRVR